MAADEVGVVRDCMKFRAKLYCKKKKGGTKEVNKETYNENKGNCTKQLIGRCPKQSCHELPLTRQSNASEFADPANLKPTAKQAPAMM